MALIVLVIVIVITITIIHTQPYALRTHTRDDRSIGACRDKNLVYRLGLLVSANSVASLATKMSPAASIWFKIWGGSCIRVKKFRFYRKLSEKFGFFQAISQTKKSTFQGKFSNNLDFSGDFT